MTIALVIAALFMGLALGIAVLAFPRTALEPVTQWPAPDPLQQHDFTGELAAIGVAPAPGPNYWRTDEYLPIQVAPEPEVEPEQPTFRWFEQPVADDEPTPLMPPPVAEYDVRELSATHSWNRAALRARLGMDEEAAA